MNIRAIALISLLFFLLFPYEAYTANLDEGFSKEELNAIDSILEKYNSKSERSCDMLENITVEIALANYSRADSLFKHYDAKYPGWDDINLLSHVAMKNSRYFRRRLDVELGRVDSKVKSNCFPVIGDIIRTEDSGGSAGYWSLFLKVNGREVEISIDPIDVYYNINGIYSASYDDSEDISKKYKKAMVYLYKEGKSWFEEGESVSAMCIF